MDLLRLMSSAACAVPTRDRIRLEVCLWHLATFRCDAPMWSLLNGGLNRSTQHFILKRKDGVYNGSKISSRFHRGGENGIMGPLAAWGVLEGDWTSIW